MALSYELVRAGFSSGQALGVGGQANTALTPLGSSLATAAPMLASMVIVTATNGTTAITLPPHMQVGDEVWVFNNSASTLPVYPQTSTVAIAVPGTGLGTAGSAFSQLTYKTAIYKMVSTTQVFVNVTA